jgi:hypothetical protein
VEAAALGTGDLNIPDSMAARNMVAACTKVKTEWMGGKISDIVASGASDSDPLDTENCSCIARCGSSHDARFFTL